MVDTAPTPDIATLTRFLPTCPMLHGLSSAQVEPLAKHVRMRRYSAGAYLIRNEIPGRESPLRVVVHGHASWDSADAHQQTGAWMMQPGSVVGVTAVNDWCYHAGIEDTWPREQTPKVRCQATGELWVLELAPDRFDDVFDDPAGAALRDALLARVPTSVSAPEVVQALRETVQFSQLGTHALHRLLEFAPTIRYARARLQDELAGEVEELSVAPSAGGPAIYYVLDGELIVDMNEETISLRTGELGGPELFAPAGTLAHVGAHATQTTHAVVITQAAVVEMMRSTPGFARKLGPRRYGKRVSP